MYRLVRATCWEERIVGAAHEIVEGHSGNLTIVTLGEGLNR
jgi:hypothetical protein